MDDALRLLEAVRSDRLHGARQLTLTALEALRRAVEAGPEGPALLERARRTAEQVAHLRPGMAPLRNLALRFLAGLQDPRRETALDLLDALQRDLEEAGRRVAEHALRVLPPEGAVATCSYSSTVVSALALAHRRGHRLEVWALLSEWGGVRHGERTAQALQEAGVPVRLYPDDALAEVGDGVRVGVIGADRVLPDGTVLNGVPSGALADALRGRAPLYALADTWKFARTLEAEPGLEPVPPDRLAGIVTEHGVLRPEEVEGWMPPW